MRVGSQRVRRGALVCATISAYVLITAASVFGSVAIVPGPVPVPVNQPPVTGVGSGDGQPTVPAEVLPATTVPTTTVPATTVPATTVPVTTVPATTSPGPSSPGPITAGSTVPPRPTLPGATTTTRSTATTPGNATTTGSSTTTGGSTTTIPTTPAALRVALAAALNGSTSAEPSAYVSIEGVGAAFEVQPDAARLPASTQKIYTLATAMLQLGVDYRFVTQVRATTAPDPAGIVRGDLLVVAGGDPTMHTSDLRRLAAEVFAGGVRSVTGSVTLDDSRFDAVRVNPGWKDRFSPGEVGALSAFVVDGNHGRDQIGDPGLANLARFSAALRAAGVSVAGPPRRVGGTPTGAVVVTHRSEPLSEIAKRVGKDSDNTYAEVLLKELAAATPPASTAAGAVIIAERARSLGVPAPAAQYDGSGLSSLDRTTTRAEVAWMSAVDRSSVGPTFRASLAVSCVDGTMRSRLCGTTQRRVIAKTGTLDGVTGLTGFVTTASGRKVTFSFLLNQVASVAKGRAAIDQALTLIASYPG